MHAAPEKSSLLRAPWPISILTYVGVLAVAAVTQLVGTEIPGAIDGSFFAVCATVAPLFGLALFVDIGLVMAPAVAEKGPTESVRAAIRIFVRVNVGMLVLSEGTALYAIGTDRVSAFLLTCSVLPWCVQLFLLAATTYHRTGIRRIGPSRPVKDVSGG